MYNTQPCARSTFFGANPPTPHMAGSSSPSSTPPSFRFVYDRPHSLEPADYLLPTLTATPIRLLYWLPPPSPPLLRPVVSMPHLVSILGLGLLFRLLNPYT